MVRKGPVRKRSVRKPLGAETRLSRVFSRFNCRISLGARRFWLLRNNVLSYSDVLHFFFSPLSIYIGYFIDFIEAGKQASLNDEKTSFEM